MSRKSSLPTLPTTSYIILGMLALRPWSAYELTQQLRRSLSYCWPKAESVLYDEPKRLVRLGLATPPAASRRAAAPGRPMRSPTRGAGRSKPGWRPGPIPPLRARDHAAAGLRRPGDQGGAAGGGAGRPRLGGGAVRDGREQVRGYLDDGGPFPDRLHIIALFARFYADLFELVIRWAELAETEIQAWPRTDGLGMTERTHALLEELVRRPEAGGGAEREPSTR